MARKRKAIDETMTVGVENTTKTAIFDDIDSFTDKVKEEIAARFPEHNVERRDVTKNNGMVYHGILICKEDSRVAPTIYIDDYFEKYKAGMKSEDVANIVAEIYSAHECPEASKFDFVCDYEQVKRYICFKLINTEKNKELLEDIPYIPLCDLSVVFYVLFGSDEDGGSSSLLIRNDLLKEWGAGIEDLYSAAMNNVKEMLPSYVSPLTDMVKEMAANAGMNTSGIPEMPGQNIFVATNTKKFYGAGVMLYDGFMQNFAEEFEDDLYILPSSVHEVIFMPKSKVDDKNVLAEMVSEVNATLVRAEDVLSDNVYLYDRAKHVISVA